MGGGAYAYYQIMQQGFKQEQVQLEIAAPANANLNEPISLVIKYTNNNSVELKDAHLKFQTPPEFTIVSVNPPISLNYSDNSGGDWSLGTLAPKKNGQIEILGRFIGQADGPVSLKSTLVYVPSTASSHFQNEATASTKIVGLPLNLSIEATREVANGYDVSYQLKVRNDGTQPFQNLRTNLEYPAGFTFLNSSDDLVSGNSGWNIATLEPGQEASLQVVGQLEGSAGEQKQVTATVGTGDPTNFQKITEKQTSTDITPPPVAITQRIEGDHINFQPGEDLNFALDYENKSDRPIGQSVIMVKIEGNAFDLQKVSADNGGWWDSNNQRIVWQAGATPELKVINLGARGSLGFHLKVADTFTPGNHGTEGSLVSSIGSPEMPTSEGENKIIAGNTLSFKLASGQLAMQNVIAPPTPRAESRNGNRSNSLSPNLTSPTSTETPSQQTSPSNPQIDNQNPNPQSINQEPNSNNAAVSDLNEIINQNPGASSQGGEDLLSLMQNNVDLASYIGKPAHLAIPSENPGQVPGGDLDYLYVYPPQFYYIQKLDRFISTPIKTIYLASGWSISQNRASYIVNDYEKSINSAFSDKQTLLADLKNTLLDQLKNKVAVAEDPSDSLAERIFPQALADTTSPDPGQSVNTNDLLQKLLTSNNPGVSELLEVLLLELKGDSVLPQASQVSQNSGLASWNPSGSQSNNSNANQNTNWNQNNQTQQPIVQQPVQQTQPNNNQQQNSSSQMAQLMSALAGMMGGKGGGGSGGGGGSSSGGGGGGSSGGPGGSPGGPTSSPSSSPKTSPINPETGKPLGSTIMDRPTDAQAQQQLQMAQDSVQNAATQSIKNMESTAEGTENLPTSTTNTILGQQTPTPQTIQPQLPGSGAPPTNPGTTGTSPTPSNSLFGPSNPANNLNDIDIASQTGLDRAEMSDKLLGNADLADSLGISNSNLLEYNSLQNISAGNLAQAANGEFGNSAFQMMCPSCNVSAFDGSGQAGLEEYMSNAGLTPEDFSSRYVDLMMDKVNGSELSQVDNNFLQAMDTYRYFQAKPYTDNGLMSPRDIKVNNDVLNSDSVTQGNELENVRDPSYWNDIDNNPASEEAAANAIDAEDAGAGAEMSKLSQAASQSQLPPNPAEQGTPSPTPEQVSQTPYPNDLELPPEGFSDWLDYGEKFAESSAGELNGSEETLGKNKQGGDEEQGP